MYTGKTTHQIKALLVGAFFIFFSKGLFAAEPALCPSDRYDEAVTVSKVTDGDTLVLRDGRKVRVIGINAAEMGNEDHPAEPFAEAAKAMVQKLVKSSENHVKLRYGKQRYDQYDRLLAHVFLADGQDLNSKLLKKGLAVVVAIPPNLWHLDCNRKVEASARKAKLGLWSLKRYRGISTAELAATDGGYYSVEGEVTRFETGHKVYWLRLGKQFSARIGAFDVYEFRDLDLKTLKGKKIRVSGWINKSKTHYRMRLHHVSQLELLN